MQKVVKVILVGTILFVALYIWDVLHFVDNIKGKERGTTPAQESITEPTRQKPQSNDKPQAAQATKPKGLGIVDKGADVVALPTLSGAIAGPGSHSVRSALPAGWEPVENIRTITHPYARGLSGSEHWDTVVSIRQAVIGAEGKLPWTAVDAGGNEGGVTMGLLSAGFTTTTFEAVPYNCRIIREAIRLSELQDRGKVICRPIHYETGVNVEIDPNPITDPNNKDVGTQYNGQIDMSKQNTGSTGAIVQKTIRMDNVLNQDVTVFKIDVEGSEYNGIQGVAKLFDNHKVYLVLSEYSPITLEARAPGDSFRYLEFFLNRGYDIYVAQCDWMEQLFPEEYATLPVKCAKTEAMVVQTLMWRKYPPAGVPNDVVKRAVDHDITQYKLTPDTAKALIRHIDGSVKKGCCLLNLIMAKV